MKQKYVIEGDCNGIKYWLQLDKSYGRRRGYPQYRWNGLKDNASVFHSRKMGLEAIRDIEQWDAKLPIELVHL